MGKKDLITKIGKFINESEFNVKITIIPGPEGRVATKESIEKSWRGAIEASIGSKILKDDKNSYIVKVQTSCTLISKGCLGTEILYYFWEDFIKSEDIIRIDLQKLDENGLYEHEKHSWIIAIK